MMLNGATDELTYAGIMNFYKTGLQAVSMVIAYDKVLG